MNMYFNYRQPPARVSRKAAISEVYACQTGANKAECVAIVNHEVIKERFQLDRCTVLIYGPSVVSLGDCDAAHTFCTSGVLVSSE